VIAGRLPHTRFGPNSTALFPFAGFAVRADFEGGALSSDLPSVLLRGNAHSTNVELVQFEFNDLYTDFLFGLTGNRRLKKTGQAIRHIHPAVARYPPRRAPAAAKLAHFSRAGLSGPLLAVGFSHRPESPSHGLER
tara:strand:+ start:28 stop:435 length:408 start_codon:yes stop_codon:yes gene_type:complete